MAWTFVSQGGTSTDKSASSLTIAETSASVAAGDLVVVWVKWENGATTVSCSDGTSSLTNWGPGNLSVGGADQRGTLFYLLSSVATGTVTYTATFGAGRSWRGMCVMVYRPSAAASLDGTATGTSGTSTAANSGNLTTTGTDGVAFGAYGEFGDPIASPLINGSAADQFRDNSASGSSREALWAKSYTSGFTGAASGTLSAVNQWICGVIAFKIAAGGGGSILRQIMQHHHRCPQPSRTWQRERGSGLYLRAA